MRTIRVFGRTIHSVRSDENLLRSAGRSVAWTVGPVDEILPLVPSRSWSPFGVPPVIECRKRLPQDGYRICDALMESVQIEAFPVEGQPASAS